MLPLILAAAAAGIALLRRKTRKNPPKRMAARKKRRSTRKSRSFLSFRPRIGRITKRVLPRTAPGFVAYHNGNVIAAGSSRQACRADLRAVRSRFGLPYRPVSIRQVQDWRMYQHNPKKRRSTRKAKR